MNSKVIKNNDQTSFFPDFLSQNPQFNKFKNKISLKEEAKNQKLNHAQKKYDLQMAKLIKKYYQKKEKLDCSFQHKIKRLENYYQKKIKINKQKLQVDCEKHLQTDMKSKYLNKYSAKNQSLHLTWNEFKKHLKKRYEQDSQKLESWFHEKSEDIQWDFKTYGQNLNKSLTTFEQNYIAKTKYRFDRKLYYQIYKKENSLLEKETKFIQRYISKSTLSLAIVNEYDLSYLPLILIIKQRKIKIDQQLYDYFLNTKKKFINLRFLTLKDLISFKLFSIPFYIYFATALIVVLAIVFNAFAAETLGWIALLFVIAIIGGEIFNRLPIWKTFLGGGTMGVFFLAAILGTFNVIPVDIISGAKKWFDTGGFLNLYINILIVGSILVIPKKLISRSFSGFIVLLAAGTFLAIGAAYFVSEIIGLSIKDTILQLMLPLLSDGNGGGVQPLSKMSQAYGYKSFQDYMSFALAVSSVSNVFVIIIAAILTTTLSKSPALSGHGKLVKKEILLHEQKVIPNDRNIAAGLFITCAIYLLCKLIEISIKRATGIEINAFAWAVIFSLLLNLSGLLPNELKAGCNALTKFFSKQITWFLMAGIGLTMTDLDVFASLFSSWKYILLIVVMDIALVIGPLLIAKLIKFYPLESAITAGCCMGAQGGAGSLAVLGAGKCMDLLPYTQITCRIGGGLVLIVASPIFIAFTQHG